MGSTAKLPTRSESTEDEDESTARLGDVIAGRLADVDIDSVEAVRDVRKPR